MIVGSGFELVVEIRSRDMFRKAADAASIDE
jgi:hypothetical protein